jgi:hypothetical protein
MPQSFELAECNIGRAKAPMDDPVMAGFAFPIRARRREPSAVAIA